MDLTPIAPPEGKKWIDFAETDTSNGSTPCIRAVGNKRKKDKEGTMFYDWDLTTRI
jgi:hypothetical protein